MACELSLVVGRGCWSSMPEREVGAMAHPVNVSAEASAEKRAIFFIGLEIN